MVNIKCPNEIKLASPKKKKEFIIYLDMDGVLTAWTERACEISGLDIKIPEIRDELKKGAYLDDIKGYGEDVWDNVMAEGQSFWESLDQYPWAKKLFDTMQKHGNVYILTSPGVCTDAPSGKMVWIQNNFGDIEKLIICKDKYRCATKNTILIDDSYKKIDAFREAGGHAFLWPNPCSLEDGDIDVDETIDKLVEEIKSYKKD
jgi:5'(3')-deoxyribonucleotidase